MDNAREIGPLVFVEFLDRLCVFSENTLNPESEELWAINLLVYRFKPVWIKRKWFPRNTLMECFYESFF